MPVATWLSERAASCSSRYPPPAERNMASGSASPRSTYDIMGRARRYGPSSAALILPTSSYRVEAFEASMPIHFKYLRQLTAAGSTRAVFETGSASPKYCLSERRARSCKALVAEKTPHQKLNHVLLVSTDEPKRFSMPRAWQRPVQTGLTILSSSLVWRPQP
jgi:hypothetical protein